MAAVKMADKLKSIGEYYTKKLTSFGATPAGVDWNGEEGQTLRFVQLERLFDISSVASIADIGCGYGALLTFLRGRGFRGDYVGIDISAEMIDAARGAHSNDAGATFDCARAPARACEYAVASGIMNVRLDTPDDEWRTHIENTIAVLDRAGERGFAFNSLTSYSDPERMVERLYYADPCWLFDLCKSKYSRNVALLHDYDLYEFTILVRK